MAAVMALARLGPAVPRGALPALARMLSHTLTAASDRRACARCMAGMGAEGRALLASIATHDYSPVVRATAVRALGDGDGADPDDADGLDAAAAADHSAAPTAADHSTMHPTAAGHSTTTIHATSTGPLRVTVRFTVTPCVYDAGAAVLQVAVRDFAAQLRRFIDDRPAELEALMRLLRDWDPADDDVGGGAPWPARTGLLGDVSTLSVSSPLSGRKRRPATTAAGGGGGAHRSGGGSAGPGASPGHHHLHGEAQQHLLPRYRVRRDADISALTTALRDRDATVREAACDAAVSVWLSHRHRTAAAGADHDYSHSSHSRHGKGHSHHNTNNNNNNNNNSSHNSSHNSHPDSKDIVAAVARALGDKDARVRGAAARALSRVGVRAAAATVPGLAETLCDLLRDSHYRARYEACVCLGSLGDGATGTSGGAGVAASSIARVDSDACARAVAAVLRSGTVQRSEAGRTLAALGRAGIGFLLRAVSDPQENVQVRIGAAAGLAHVHVDSGAVHEAADALFRATSDRQPLLRRALLEALGALYGAAQDGAHGGGGTVPFLTERSFLPFAYTFLRDPDVPVRETAACLLAHAGPPGALLLTEALLRDANATVRAAAAYGLSHSATRGCVRALLLGMHDTDPAVRHVVARGLLAAGVEGARAEDDAGGGGIALMAREVLAAPFPLAQNVEALLAQISS
jgi:HEAT repeat protein